MSAISSKSFVLAKDDEPGEFGRGGDQQVWHCRVPGDGGDRGVECGGCRSHYLRSAQRRQGGDELVKVIGGGVGVDGDTHPVGDGRGARGLGRPPPVALSLDSPFCAGAKFGSQRWWMDLMTVWLLWLLFLPEQMERD